MSDSRRVYKAYTKQQSRNSNRPTDICINYNSTLTNNAVSKNGLS